MALILDSFSRTFSEYLLIPRLTKRGHLSARVSTKTPLARFYEGDRSRLYLDIPIVSASMQAVSGVDMGVALAGQGGAAFVFCSQPISLQAAMIADIAARGALTAAGVNTHDYQERLPALVEAGVSVVAFDSSDGFSEFQCDAAIWARKEYGDSLVIGGGNVVSAEGFRYLAEEAKVDFVMMGRYFAMTRESPTQSVFVNGKLHKPYWGEGSSRARNWQRYSEAKTSGGFVFEEGVDGYVPVMGSVEEVLRITFEKLRSTMCNMGSLSLREFTDKAVLTLVSEQSIAEGGASTIT